MERTTIDLWFGAFVLARLTRLPGRTLFRLGFLAPMVLPEVPGVEMFKALPGGGYKSIPLTLQILPLSSGGSPQTRINGQPAPEPLVWDLLQYDRLEISIEM